MILSANNEITHLCRFRGIAMLLRFLFFLMPFLLCTSWIQISTAQPLDEDVSQEERKSPPPIYVAPQHLSAEEVRDLVLSKDIVVIHRKFLPKTSRFEFFPNVGWLINNPFYYNFVGSGRLGFHFSEYLGMELFGGYVFGLRRKVTRDLESRQIEVNGVVSPRYLYGISIKYTPFYGKFARIGGGILPFDMYLSGGGGMSQLETRYKGNLTHRQECNAKAITVNLEAGQLIPLSKGSALRWSVGWFLHPKIFDWSCDGGATPNLDLGFQTDVYMSLGWSLFFPGAKYR